MVKKLVSLLLTLAVIIVSITALFLSSSFTSRKASSEQVGSEIQTITSEPQESIEVPPLGFPSLLPSSQSNLMRRTIGR